MRLGLDHGFGDVTADNIVRSRLLVRELVGRVLGGLRIGVRDNDAMLLFKAACNLGNLRMY
jgi:hypothetical protein